MIIKYVNHTGQFVNLNQYPYKMLVSDILDYDFEVKKTNGRITGFNTRTVKSKSINIDVHRYQGVSSKKSMSDLSDLFGKDLAAEIPGRLYIDDWYLSCFFNSRSTSRWETDVVISCEYELIMDKTVWVQEMKRSFLAYSAPLADGLDFAFDYTFDYATNKQGSASWDTEHYAASDFKIILYGPCSDPRILVNGYPYQIFTDLETTDYLVLDSRDNTIIKHRANGTTEDLYNSRQFTPSVFQKIPGGRLLLDWSGTFGFDMILFAERSDPKW